MQISELEMQISHLKLSEGGDEARRASLLRERAAAEKRMVDVLAP